MSRYLIIPVLLLALVFAAPAAFASACTNPAGTEGDQIYNSTYHVMQFCNGTHWVNMGAGGAAGQNGTNGALTLISTQTASNSATLQWTGLGSSYNTYLLDCNGLQPVANSVKGELQFGEGSTPTWEAANYVWARYSFIIDAANGVNGSGSDSNIPISGSDSSMYNGSATNVSAKIWIHNVASSTIN